ncbi:ABC transporter [Anaerocolumna cellulosilytica]|uniref:ABC transporter n=1 Tax=Anaerocolumna cellulosilytica TaxID=433286 RepID=A0A6S6R541_9FIRM|nr:ABC transporter ATP-binding protein [Anaerocolumna cellulosilytica]MBB5194216.1 iron complex transport system ATP-binding protein [Anaerocolumna cellulosilytica]BCJ94572.1 ABC transporter [Anaerocolumna cellulosilytica]
MSIQFRDIEVKIGNKDILKKVSLKAEDNKITGIIGPNGSGKSTLIKTFFSLLPHHHGEIFLDDHNVKAMSSKEIARNVAYIGQDSNSMFDFTVEEIIKMGRFPHDSTTRNIKDIVYDALDTLKINEFAKRSIRTLSGGERKLVYLARSIAQNTDSIILDEPTNHLDIKHQYMIMNYLKSCNKTILVVIHDINLALRFCDKIYMMKEGTVYQSGSVHEVFTEQNIKSVFEVDGVINRDSKNNIFFTVEK